MKIGPREKVIWTSQAGYVRWQRRINGTLYVFSVTRKGIEVWRAIDGTVVHRFTR